MPITIDVVIPAYNEEQGLSQCLSSIIANRTSEVQSIFVVNNNSTDRTAEIASKFPEVTLLNEPRKGNTYAKNMGLQHATSDIVAFIDADVTLPPDWFIKVTRRYASIPSLVCYSGPYIHPDLSRVQKWILRLYSLFIIQPLSIFAVNYITGGNCAIKKSAINAIGGFDTNRSLGGEDLNLVQRLGKVGKCIFSQELIAFSSGRRFRNNGFLKTSITYFIASWGQMFLNHYFIRPPKDFR